MIVSRGTSNEMSTLTFKDSLFDHDRIGTGERSSARLLLGGKALVTVRELSSLTTAEQPDRAGLRLTGGTVALAVAGQRMRPDESVDIHLPNAVASARGAVLIAEATRATDRAVSVIHVLSGRVEVITESATLWLTRHHSVTVTDGRMGPITTLTDRELEHLAASLRPDRLRRAEPPSSSASRSARRRARRTPRRAAKKLRFAPRSGLREPARSHRARSRPLKRDPALALARRAPYHRPQ